MSKIIKDDEGHHEDFISKYINLMNKFI